MSTSPDLPFKVAVNGVEHEVSATEAHHLDLIETGDATYHALKNSHSHHVELIEADYRTKTFKMKVNGNTHTAKISDKYDQLVQQLGLTAGGGAKNNDLKAPMPGLVLDVAVEAGQAVKKGDKLLILEAMKMENVLKAAADGTVVAVHVSKSQPVDKGQLLIELA